MAAYPYEKKHAGASCCSGGFASPVHCLELFLRDSFPLYRVISFRLCLLLAVLGHIVNAQIPAAKPVAKAPQLVFRPADPLNASAYDHFYNMEYESSIQEFTQIQARHPDDPDAVNHLLTAVLFHELYRIGALNAGEYANDSFVNASRRAADKKTCEQIKSLVQKALAIEERRLSANPKDIATIYARGVT